MGHRNLKPLGAIGKKDRVGNKALSLTYLKRKGFRVPKTFVVPDRVRREWMTNPRKVEENLASLFRRLLPDDRRYAVRSSAEVEDGAWDSFAGQFDTLLNVEGSREILQAVKRVWESAGRVARSAYGKAAGLEKPGIPMGVIVQEMVDARWSGVGFSINPVTGRDEVILEGVEGSGEQLVQQGKTPSRWIHSQGRWLEEAEEGSPGEEVLDALVAGIRKLSHSWDAEVDVEWAWDGTHLWYLQSRVVTSRGYPAIYSNRISREFLPGMIKPLVWSVNIPLVNGAWIRLLEDMTGPLDIRPEQLSRSFYYRAYFNMGTLGAIFRLMGFPRNALEQLMGRTDPSGKSAFRPSLRTFRYVPRMMGFILTRLTLGRQFRNWMERFEREGESLRSRLDEGFGPGEYPELFREIRNKASEAAYYNILIPLSMHLHNRILKRKLDRRGIPMDKLDFFSDFPGLQEWDPRSRLSQLHRLWTRLPEKNREVLTHAEEDRHFSSAFASFLEQFGHFSESGNDFSYPHWREDPAFVLRMVAQTREDTLRETIPPGSLSGGGLRRSYRRAGAFRLYREMISSLYTREYGLFRKLFLHTGKLLAGRGLIGEPGDVFYLELEEHDFLLSTGRDLDGIPAAERIRRRKEEMKEQEEAELPPVIYGDTPPPLVRKDQRVMEGVPTSPGIFSGRIVVVRGYADFEKDVEGAILVIPFADVGWTPVLVKAGAIVSESGGMLSHAAIVARERSIPSVSSVENACRLKDGATASVDGYRGLVILEG